MSAPERPRTRKSILDVLVGIELGIIGGAAMLVFFALTCPLMGQPWWLIPNLFASSFYTSRLARLGPGVETLVGAAFHLMVCGLLGAVTGLTTTGGRLFGIGIAIAWYILCYFFLWKRIAPQLLVYGSQPLLMAGFYLYGSTLGWHSQLVERVRR